MQKKVLSEKALYQGKVLMPKGFEINPFILSKSIFESTYMGKDFIFTSNWDRLNKYLIEHIRLKYKLNLVNKKTWGNMYLPGETTKPILNIDPVDLRNSPDFTLLYGINATDCSVRIYYDDNRRKGRSWDVELKHNMFVMFPSTSLYYIENNQKNLLNFIQTITYEFI